jgi:autotransporter-associated beta strand protein
MSRGLLAAAASLLAGMSLPSLQADYIVPARTFSLYGDPNVGGYDASSGTIYVINDDSTALITQGDVSPNNYVIKGGGHADYITTPGALQIIYGAVVSGNVTIAGDTIISSQVTGLKGTTGTISGRLLEDPEATGTLTLTLGWPVWSSATPIEASASTLILLGDNAGFTGDIRIGLHTTLQLGNGGDFGDLASARAITFLGNAADGARLVVNRAGTITISSIIAGPGSIEKLGTGTLNLAREAFTTPSTFTGDLIVRQGTLAFNGIDVLGSGNKNINLHEGTTLSYSGAADILDFPERITVNLSGNATLEIPSSTETILPILKSSSVGGKRLTKVGSGVLTLSGTTDNTGAGLAASAGTVNLAKVDSSSGVHAISSGGLGISGDAQVIITGTGGDQIADDAPVNIADTGTFDLNGNNEAIGALTGVQSAVINNLLDTPVTFSVGSNVAAANNIYAGSIEGNIDFVKKGADTLIITGNLNYTGSTTIDGGVLQVGNGTSSGALGSATTAITVNSSGTLAFNLVPQPGNALTFSREIIGTGSLRKDGSSTLTLTGAASYTGATIVTGGVLVLGAEAAPSSLAVQISDGAQVRVGATGGGEFTLTSPTQASYAGHTGTSTLPDIDGSVSLANGHTLTVGGVKTLETLSISGDLKLDASTAKVSLGNSGLSDLITAKNVQLLSSTAGTVKLELNFLNGVQTGNYNLIHWEEAGIAESQLPVFNLSLAGGPMPTPRDGSGTTVSDNLSLRINIENKNLVLEFAGNGNHRLRWASTSSTWKANNDSPVPDDGGIALSEKWTDISTGDTPSVFYDYDLVEFDAPTSSTSPNISISGDVTPSRITILGGNHTFTLAAATVAADTYVGGGGKITGKADILKDGTGTLTIRGAHDFTGVVEISEGVVNLEDTSINTGSAGNPTVISYTTLIGNYGDASAIGAGTTPASILFKSGQNTTLRFSGTTAQKTNRSFTLGAQSSTSAGGRIEIMTNPIVIFNGTDPIAYEGTGNRKLTLAGSMGSTTATEFCGGVMSLPLEDPINGKLTIEKSGSGTWYLQKNTIDHTYSGGIILTGGTLAIGQDSLGAVPEVFDADSLTINDGAIIRNLKYTGDGTSAPTAADVTVEDIVFEATRGIYLTRTSTATTGSVFRIGQTKNDSTITVNSAISGSGMLTVDGFGTLELAGVNTFSGGFRILGNATVKVGESGTEAIPHASISEAAGVSLEAGATLSLNGSDVIIRRFSDSRGTIINDVIATTSTLIVDAPSSTASTFRGNLEEGTDAQLALTKKGTGALNLQLGNDSNFSGPIRVEAGRLALNDGGAGSTDNPIGNASVIIVDNNATLDLRGSSITAKQETDGGGNPVTDVNGNPVIELRRTIYITGAGAADAGALANSLIGGNATADNVTLLGNATIKTAAFLELSRVRGTGSLTLGASLQTGGAGFYIRGTNLYPTPSIELTPGATGVASALNVNTYVRVTAAANETVSVGAININADGNLLLETLDSTVRQIIKKDTPTAVTGTLTLIESTEQEFQFLSGVASSRITHISEVFEESVGTIIFDTPDLAAATGFTRFDGRIGSIATADPGTGSANLHLTKRGPGEYTLSNPSSDYIGNTRIEDGTLILNAVLTNGTTGTGVLGAADILDAGRLVIGNASLTATLRDISNVLSTTERLLTISAAGAVIESDYNRSGVIANSRGPGLQFNAVGAIRFETPNPSGVTLVLGGDKDPSAEAASNVFAPSIPDAPGGIPTALVKRGLGEWVLGRENTRNTYTGGTTILAGTLALGSATALPEGTELLIGGESSYGRLRINGHSVRLENLRASSETGSMNEIVNGALQQGGPNWPTVTLNVANATQTSVFTGSLGSTGDYFDSSVYDNAFHVIKEGPGTQVLSGGIYYSGDTEVREGELRLVGIGEFAAKTHVFIGAPEGVTPSVAPWINVSQLPEGLYIRASGQIVGQSTRSQNNLVAGNMASVVQNGDGKYQVRIDNTRNIQGDIRLAGGNIRIGGQKYFVEEHDIDGNPIIVTKVEDTVARLTIAGNLYSVNNSRSSLYYTFGIESFIENQDVPEDTEQAARAKLPTSDYLVANHVDFQGVVQIVIDTSTSGRLDSGTEAAPVSYPIISYNTISEISLSRLQVAITDERYNISFHNESSTRTLYMDVVGKTGGRIYWVGNEDAETQQWGDPAANGVNFVLASDARVSFAPGNHAVFDDRVQLSPLRVITISSQGVILGAATFDSRLDYTLAESGGPMKGEGYLEKYGEGTLFINNANTYTGGTYLGKGKIVLGNESALSTGTIYLQGGTLVSNGNARILPNTVYVQGTTTVDTSGGNITFAGELSDGATEQHLGTLVKIGSGTLSLTGSNENFTGLFQLTAGTLSLGPNANPANATFSIAADTYLTVTFEGDRDIVLGSVEGSGTIYSVTPGAKNFRVGNASDGVAVFSGAITDGTDGSVQLTKEGDGTLVLTGNANTYTGGTIVSKGTLQIGGGSHNGSVGNALAPIFIERDAKLVFNGDRLLDNQLAQDISGTGTLEKQNTNALIIVHDNDNFSGKVVISGGEFRLGKGEGSGSVGSATIYNDATLVLNRGGGDYTMGNNISGTGDIQKLDGSRLTYIGDNTSSGNTLVYLGTLSIGNGALERNQLYSAQTIYLLGSTLELNPGAGGINLSADITGVAGTVDKIGTHTAVLAGDVSFSGAVNLKGGVLQIGDGADRGSIQGSAQIHLETGTLIISRSDTAELSGRIYSTGGGEIRITGGTTGTGTVILSENNEISGTVSVENHATLQIGRGEYSGSFNSTNAAVNVQLARGATLAFSHNGDDVRTGSTLFINGSGNFVKRGPGTTFFDSVGYHVGGTIVEEGRLIISTSNLPRALLDPTYDPEGLSYLAANGEGILELRNGDIPFTLERHIRGTGTVALGADDNVGVGTYTRFDFVPANNSGILHAIEVGERTLLNFGADAAARLNAEQLRVLSGGLLSGQGTVAGSLFVELGGEVRPGGLSTGQITALGNIASAGNIAVRLIRGDNGALLHDTLHYTGSAVFESGATVYIDISALGNDLPLTGEKFQIFIDDDLTDNPAGGSVSGVFIQSNPALNGVAYIYNNSNGLSLLFGSDLSEIPNLRLHDSLGNFVSYINTILANTNPDFAARRTVDALLSGDPSTTFNKAAPLAFASMTAMSVTNAHSAAASMRSHLEGLRYERVINEHAIEFTPYVSVSGTFARNRGGNNDPVFDFNNYSGTVGIDHSWSENFTFGINANYNRGSATLHDNAGKIETETAGLSVYASIMPTRWIYFDLQAYGGYSTYDSKRFTHLGRETASPEGYDLGVAAYVGTIIPVTQRVHFTPFAGFEYVHASVDAFTETGSLAALSLQEITQNSLQVKFGTNLNWVSQLSNFVVMRLALEVAYAVQLVDSETGITGQFANDTTRNRFNVDAPATPERSLQVGPAVEFSLGTNHSLRFNYTYEADFGAHTVHHLNATYRIRF